LNTLALALAAVESADIGRTVNVPWMDGAGPIPHGVEKAVLPFLNYPHPPP
jgi:hypothetical protein